MPHSQCLRHLCPQVRQNPIWGKKEQKKTYVLELDAYSSVSSPPSPLRNWRTVMYNVQ